MVKDNDCIFCKIAKKEIPVKIIYENKNFIAFPDANPRVKGHTLIITKKHFVNVMDLPVILGKDLLDAIKNVAAEKLKAGFDGFSILQNNFPSAGQVVMHAHFHLLPRTKGDNVDPFRR